MRSVASTNSDGPNSDGPPAPWAVGRIVWAVVAAAAVLALNLAASVPVVGGWLSAAAVAVALVALRPLVPRGTLTARRELPSVVLLRGLAAASFFGAEVYLPYLLIDHYDFSPALAGLALTFGALAWAATSWLQGRMGGALSHRVATTVGTALLFAAIVVAFATALLTLSPFVAIAGWLLGGGGMGLMYPRISVMTLAMSTEQNQGFNSSAMSISDSLGSALALAVTGIVFAAFSFAGVFGFAGVIAALAIVVAPRVAGRKAGVPIGVEAATAELLTGRYAESSSDGSRRLTVRDGRSRRSRQVEQRTDGGQDCNPDRNPDQQGNQVESGRQIDGGRARVVRGTYGTGGQLCSTSHLSRSQLTLPARRGARICPIHVPR